MSRGDILSVYLQISEKGTVYDKELYDDCYHSKVIDNFVNRREDFFEKFGKYDGKYLCKADGKEVINKLYKELERENQINNIVEWHDDETTKELKRLEVFLSQIVHNPTFDWEKFCIIACLIENEDEDEKIIVPDEGFTFLNLDDDSDWDDFDDFF